MPKAPNEKLIEMLFNYNALRFLEGEKVTMYAPSTREEFACGYDSKLMGANGFEELYIQFKTPNLLENYGRSVPTTPHQHARLLHYPPKTAYYVTHTFHEIHQVQELQRTITSPEEFLRRYFAIEANHFEQDVTRIRYYVYDDEHPEEITYKLRLDPGRRPSSSTARGCSEIADEPCSYVCIPVQRVDVEFFTECRSETGFSAAM